MLSNIARFLYGAQTATVCDPVEPMTAPFEADRYMGTWYNIQHSTGAIFQPDFFDCT